ncbi:MAG: hypothetical protein HQ559_04085, partial [Lentisphaerae bacterium]|nr:hypothetical protein [Lentisphaerota bacterium]
MRLTPLHQRITLFLPSHLSRAVRMFKLGLIVAMAIAVPMAAAAPRVFHVDSTAGDDRDAGDLPGRAWASLERVNRAELRPGDMVRFKRGGMWRGTLRPHSGAEAAPITYTAYGEGEKPLLLGSARRDKPSDWVKVGENVWATKRPTWTAAGDTIDLRQSEWTCHREGGAKVALRAQETPEGRAQVFRCEASGSRRNHIQAWGPQVDWKQVGDAGFLLFRFRARSTKPFSIPSIHVTRSGPPWTSYAASGAFGLAIGEAWQDCEVHMAVVTTGERPRLHMSFGGAIPAGATFEFQPLELAAAASSQERLLAIDVGNVIFDHGKACGWKRWTLDDVKRPYDYFY